MTLNSILTNLGLTTKEAKLYCTALELGSSPASEIARKAGMNRITCYDTLQKLKKKGFIESLEQSNATFFSATDPDLIRDEFRKRYLDFKSALPDLRRLHGKTKHPRVRYYEGLEAIKKIYADTLTAKTELFNYADSKSLRRYWPTYDEDYVRKRIEKGIYLRGIAPLDDYGKKVVRDNEKSHREIRLVPAGPFTFSNEINIYDDKVSIVSFSNDLIIGMLIESAEIANTQRAIFMMAWEFAGQAEG